MELLKKTNTSTLEPQPEALAAFASGKQDAVIWKEFRAGSEMAFNYIYKHYFTILYQYGHQFTKDSELVKDAIQELFIELRRNRQNLGPTSSIKFYLYRSLRRKIVRALSKKNRFIFSGHLESTYDFEIALSPEVMMINRQSTAENKKQLEAAFNKLTKRQKEALLYYYYEGLSYEEIASVMNLSKVKYARTLIYRSIDKLKQEMLLYCSLLAGLAMLFFWLFTG
ncbi:sigma-70 family RNA polymerase sigma factor [Rapidithrix thailandica]|uniref:Sigma-70 family RNA polymerase sigma factor n=1 Tax=Rapidithrix thailandica TaxID=413964 RepID=A0AAW9S3B4_9BACT